MADDQLPRAITFFATAVLMGVGFLYLFFADRVCNWQIKMLQPRWYRLFIRGFGLLLILCGAGLILGFATTLDWAI